ncbi:OmpA family protein [Marixanthomonas ophiurae]|uniref:OmpA family protein n=1 Tax=Marixanthomonas ophiurae TaxID=387659 RepID=A0A3E1Q8Y8_9FLAO|nr:OmpA family protein [Marixanthomonas ophiurae]RFN58596.1 OmpA family protein [Marixanthomonas ophiurae]
MKKLYIFLLVLFVVQQTYSQTGKTYPDGKGGEVYFPLGDISFADELVSFKVGDPAPIEGYGPEKTLQVPDYKGNYEKKYTTLGYGGELIVKFNDNTLADIEGPDLYIFEIGPLIEPVDVYISKEGENWISIGRTGGGFSEIDISEFVEPSAIFRYVKIVDIKKKKSGKWPGADIDAIGAIGSAFNFKLNSAFLFDTGNAVLKKTEELSKVVDKIKEISEYTVVVEGHTDNVGSAETNKILSEKRAQEVKGFLVKNGIIADSITTKAYGESNPVSDNTTEEGREQNRRVEIVVLPSKR